MLSKSFLGAAIGTMIEYYDMVLFLIFLPLLSLNLFGGESTYSSMQKGYLILFVTMLVRPLGGVLFGYIGDFIGRPRALLLSMYGIALATFVIGITPPFAMIGGWAIFIVSTAKAIQTFCFGGEFSGAGIYVVEQAQNKNEALSGSLLTAIAVSGSLLATIFGILLTYSFMPEWSWRLAFLLGGILGLFGIYFRKQMLESHLFIPANTHEDSFVSLLKKFPLELLAGFFIGGLSTVAYTTVVAFINPLLLAQGYLTRQELMILQTLLITFSILILILSGKLADKFTPIKIMKSGASLFILSYPILLFINSGKLLYIIAVSFLLIFLTELFFGPANAYYKNIFPMQYRYRGSSLSFCLGMSILGGVTPLLESYLYQRYQQYSLILVWIILIAAATLFSLILMDKKVKCQTLMAQ